jgi:Zn-dependent protease with chaperone function
MSNGKNRKERRYFGLLMGLSFLYGFLISLAWVIGFALLRTPVVATLSSVFIASIALFLLGLLRFYVDRKQKNVSATKADYILSNAAVFIVVVIPLLIMLSLSYLFSELGILIILYVDGVVLTIFAAGSSIPRSFSFGGHVSPISDSALVSRTTVLATKMGIGVVDLYEIGWKKFKVANAFQIGPRRFSILISDYLLEEFSPAEVDAVIAHELAHAKQRHVLKIAIAYLCFSLTGLDLLFLVRDVGRLTPGVFALFFTGLALLFGGNLFFIPYLSRRFELQADHMAVKTIEDGRTMISALKKMAELNLIPQDKTFLSWGLTHPSVSDRIKRIQEAT